MSFLFLHRLFRQEYSGGIVLFFATLCAMWLANSRFMLVYQAVTQAVLFWVNDGLMTLFFLMVGLELKRGLLEKQLISFEQVLLPVFAAFGGMLVPALIYTSMNYNDPIAIKGWSTPVPTDIAFALAVFSLCGRSLPAVLKLFLLALAIFDDLGAILIIALFYSHGLSFTILAVAGISVALLYLLRRFSVLFLPGYLFLGFGLWLSLYYAGIHPTIAGVILALFIPNNKDKKLSLSHRLEKEMQPWVTFLVMPLFALVNAGFSWQELSLEFIKSNMVLGIVFGLFFGKQIGVFGFSWLIIRYHGVKFFHNVTWSMLYGVSILCGIGFTMSLFLGTLSMQNEGYIYLAEVRAGVFLASLLSALVGAVVLFAANSHAKGKL